MALPDPVDDLEGLDDYDRQLASDMDDNLPIYADAPPLAEDQAFQPAEDSAVPTK